MMHTSTQVRSTSWRSRRRLGLLLFATGFFLGPLGDFAHVVTGTTGYPTERYGVDWMGIPFWVPFLFGSAALLVGASHLSLDRLLGADSMRIGSTSLLRVALGLLAFLGLYVASGLLPGPAGGMDDAALALGAGMTWATLDRTWQGALLALATAFCGTAFEILLIKNGIFYYSPSVSNLMGVPSWLPWLYVAASVGVGNFGRFIVQTQERE